MGKRSLTIKRIGNAVSMAFINAKDAITVKGRLDKVSDLYHGIIITGHEVSIVFGTREQAVKFCDHAGKFLR